MTAAALSVDRARAIGAAGATLCAGATLLGRHSLLRPALIAAASILGAVWLGVEPDVVRSRRERKAHFVLRAAALLSIFLACSICFALLFLPASRLLASALYGDAVPAAPSLLSALVGGDWPQPLDAELAIKQHDAALPPSYLPRARGSLRCRQLGLIAGNLVAATVAVGVVSGFCDQSSALRPPRRRPDWRRAVLTGVVAGALPAALLVAVELRLGWVAAGPAFASPAPGEPFLVTIAIEAALMAAVATTEELLFRGWIQINLQRAFQIHLGLRPARACAATAVASGLVFTFAHDSATTAASCCSLVLGSCTATLARLLSQSLATPIGWHWGWNFCLTALVGGGTSGTPITASLLTIVPKPELAHLHGGPIGAESSVLAPLAILLSAALIVAGSPSRRKSGGLLQPRPLLERLEAEAERIGGGGDDDADGAKDSDADGGEPLLTPHAATRVRFCESV